MKEGDRLGVVQSTERGCGGFFFIDIKGMPHYIVILHALRNLSFSFIITFICNNHKK